MNDTRIFSDVKRAASLSAFLEAHGSGAVVTSGATTFFNPAPCCGHNDCFSLYRDSKRDEERWKCHSCDKSGDVLEVAEVLGAATKFEALKTVAAFAGVEIPDRARSAGGAPVPRQEMSRAEFIAERCLAERKHAVDWLVAERGISEEVAQRAALKNSIGWNTWTSSRIAAGEKMHGGPALATIVRTLNPGRVVAVDLRYADVSLNGGVKTATQGEKEGYGWTSDIRRLLAAEKVYFCESAINALSIETAGIPSMQAAYAIRGTANASNIDLTWCRGKQVIIVPDNDAPGADGYAAGLKAAWTLHERLLALDVSAMLVDLADWEEGWDANDFLKAEGAEGLRRAIRKIEPWLIPGMPGDAGAANVFDQKPKGRSRVYLPYHHYTAYWRFRVREDFTSYVSEMKPSEGDEAPRMDMKELAGFRVAGISRVTIQSATATMTGDADTMPKVLFSVSVQTTRHGAKLVRRVVDDEKLHNIDVWKRFGPVWDQSRFLRMVNIMENAAHVGARHAANFVGLCWRDGRLIVNEGPDCYFPVPDQQCPYHNLSFPRGSVADARAVVKAYQATFGKNAAAMLLVWGLGGHLKSVLGFWPHLVLQADKGTGKSTIIKRLERSIAFTMFSGQSLQTEFRLLTSVSHTSHPVGWEELSARRQDVIDKAVAILQENYQFTLNRRGSDMLEFLLSAPVLLAGEDVPVKSLTGKLVRSSLKVEEQGALIPEDLPRFPVREWLEFLADIPKGVVQAKFAECLKATLFKSRSSGQDSGARRMANNYAAVMTAWRLLAEFCELHEMEGNFPTDVIREMNAHISETSSDREPWVWIMEQIAGEMATNDFSIYRIDDFELEDRSQVKCLFLRTSDVMHHIASKPALREFWNGLPVKSDRVFKKQMTQAGVILGEAERTVGIKRYSRMVAISLTQLEEFGVYVHRPDGV
jgi:hypothetical protein